MSKKPETANNFSQTGSKDNVADVPHETPSFPTPDPGNFPYNLRQHQPRWHNAFWERIPRTPIPNRRGYDADVKKDVELEKAWDQVLNAPHNNYPNQQLIQEYRRQTNKGLKKLKSDVLMHVGTFLVVNVGLFVTWLATGGGFPWFFFPVAGWGMGVISHYFNLRRRELDAKELQALPALNKRQLSKLRAFQRERDQLGDRLVSTITIPIFLAGINIITYSSFFWAAIPATVIYLHYFINLSAARQRRAGLLAELADMGVPVHQLEGAVRLELSFQDRTTNFNPMQAEAEYLKGAVLAQISRMPDKSALGENFEQVLDDYVMQVVKLSERDVEIHETFAALPVTNMESELLELQRQYDNTGSPDIRVELKRSMESVRRQHESYLDLQRQQQLLKAKLVGAINSLRQLQLDLVRIKHSTEMNELPPVNQLLDQSGEINQYLSDLEAEYRRLEEMEKD